MIGCVNRVLEAVPKCRSKIPIIVNQLESVMGSFVDTTCGEYNNFTDQCDKLEPLPAATPTSNFNATTTMGSNSFVFNLAKIIDSVNWSSCQVQVAPTIRTEQTHRCNWLRSGSKSNDKSISLLFCLLGLFRVYIRPWSVTFSTHFFLLNFNSIYSLNLVSFLVGYFFP